MPSAVSSRICQFTEATCFHIFCSFMTIASVHYEMAFKAREGFQAFLRCFEITLVCSLLEVFLLAMTWSFAHSACVAME